MRLVYHKGNNFGDKLNPIIFNHFIGELLDKNEDELFLGIGSILGLKQNLKGKKNVFTSGYAANDDPTYGSPPKIDESYNILALRGPLTAELLGIDKNLAICDGAILISEIDDYKFTNNLKGNEVVFIPHHKSEEMYPFWDALCRDAGIVFVSPQEETEIVLERIASAKLVIAEAMHGAIVADTYRVPWIPIKSYPFINEFKWKDWGASLNLDIRFNLFPSLHTFDFMYDIIAAKVNNLLPGFLIKAVSSFIIRKRENNFIQKLKKLSSQKGHLSDLELLNSKKKKLLEILANLHQSF